MTWVSLWAPYWWNRPRTPPRKLSRGVQRFYSDLPLSLSPSQREPPPPDPESIVHWKPLNHCWSSWTPSSHPTFSASPRNLGAVLPEVRDKGLGQTFPADPHDAFGSAGRSTSSAPVPRGHQLTLEPRTSSGKALKRVKKRGEISELARRTRLRLLAPGCMALSGLSWEAPTSSCACLGPCTWHNKNRSHLRASC